MQANPAQAPASKWRRAFMAALIGGFVGLSGIQIWREFNVDKPALPGAPLPDFPAEGTWLHTEAPLSMTGLRGKVVFLQFSFLGCHYCRLMDPALLKWHELYAAKGLVVIEVDDGATDSLAQVRSWAAKHKIPYPVYYDKAGKMVHNYGISGFPTMYLIGRDGNVLFQGSGWADDLPLALEEKIRSAL